MHFYWSVGLDSDRGPHIVGTYVLLSCLFSSQSKDKWGWCKRVTNHAAVGRAQFLTASNYLTKYQLIKSNSTQEAKKVHRFVAQATKASYRNYHTSFQLNGSNSIRVLTKNVPTSWPTSWPTDLLHKVDPLLPTHLTPKQMPSNVTCLWT